MPRSNKRGASETQTNKSEVICGQTPKNTGIKNTRGNVNAGKIKTQTERRGKKLLNK